VLENAVDLFKVDRGAIAYHESDGGRVVASFDRRSPAPEIIGLKFGDTPLQHAIRKADQKIFEITDIEHEPLLGEDERNALLGLGVKSTVIIPLIARGKVIGSLGLDNCNQVRLLSDWEKELALILAGLAAVAIDNARLYRVAEEGLQEIIAVSSELMQKALQPELNREQFLDYVMDRTLKLMNFEAGWLALREGEWVSIVATDQKHRVDIGRRFHMDDCISGLSMKKMELINIPDLGNMPDEYRQVYKAPSGLKMKSELVVPLVLEREAIGAFNIESNKVAGFEHRHEDMLNLLGKQVALALETKSLREETYALNRVSLELAQEAEMSSVVRSILVHALDLVFGRQRGGEERKGYGQVLLREGENLVIRYTTNKPRGELPPDDLNRPYGINVCNSGLTITERMPIVFPDVGKPEYFVVEFINTPVGREGKLIPKRSGEVLYKRALEVDKDAMVAELAVPIFSHQEVVGVLNVETPSQEGFNPEQRQALMAFVKSHEQRFVENILPIQRSELQALLSQALARLDTKFGQILRTEGEELVIEATTGGENPGGRVKQSVSRRARLEQKTIYVANVDQDPDYQRYLGEDMKSQLAVPLILENEVIGVLNIESPIPDFFRLSHVRMLEAFAGQAAMAIERARKLENVTLAEIGGLAGDIVHQLNNPLGAISMSIELLKRKSEYSKMLESFPYLAVFIERVERDSNSAKSIIKGLRPVLRIRPNHPIELKHVIDEALANIDMPQNIQVQITTFNEKLHVTANERLATAFWNLFDNARKAMAEAGGSLMITVSSTEDHQWVTVEVKDTGTGIPQWRLPYIFDTGESTSQDQYAPAHGLGLWWTRAQIANFGGTIDVQSEEGVGTCFLVKLKPA
jgi:GAF domain-containing protein